MEQNENTLSVLKIAPGQYPQQVEIDNDLLMYDVIAGTFLVVGLGEEDFVSLSRSWLRSMKKNSINPKLFSLWGVA